MKEIYIKNILKIYKMFSQRQKEILENVDNTRKFYTFMELQKALQVDKQAKEMLEKIRFIVNGEYEKAGVYKYASTTIDNVQVTDLLM